MGKREITRRQVLAGVAGVGSTGTALGTSTGAVLSDREVFSESGFTSGQLDLLVEWKNEDGDWVSSEDGEVSLDLDFEEDYPRRFSSNFGNQPGGGNGGGNGGGHHDDEDDHKDDEVDGEYKPESFDVKLSLPDEEDNNPGYVWVGSTCPKSRLAKKFGITIKYEDSDKEIFEGSLEELAKGVHIDGDASDSDSWNDRKCLEAGSELDLTVKVDPGEFDGEITDAFTFLFEAEQCRNQEPVNPFPLDGENCVKTPTPDPKHDISNITFCWTGDREVDPEFNITTQGDDDPLTMEWKTQIDVDFVVVFGGNTFTIYDHRGEDTDWEPVFVGDPSAEVFIETPDKPEETPSRACSVAANHLDDAGGSRNSDKIEDFETWEDSE